MVMSLNRFSCAQLIGIAWVASGTLHLRGAPVKSLAVIVILVSGTLLAQEFSCHTPVAGGIKLPDPFDVPCNSQIDKGGGSQRWQ